MESIKEKTEIAKSAITEALNGNRLSDGDLKIISEVIDKAHRITTASEIIGDKFHVSDWQGKKFVDLEKLAKAFRGTKFEERHKFGENKERMIDLIYTLKQMKFEESEGFFIHSNENEFWKSETPY